MERWREHGKFDLYGQNQDMNCYVFRRKEKSTLCFCVSGREPVISYMVI